MAKRGNENVSSKHSTSVSTIYHNAIQPTKGAPAKPVTYKSLGKPVVSNVLRNSTSSEDDLVNTSDEIQEQVADLVNREAQLSYVVDPQPREDQQGF